MVKKNVQVDYVLRYLGKDKDCLVNPMDEI